MTYKQDCIEAHDLTDSDVSEIEDITDNWEDIHVYKTYSGAIQDIVETFLANGFFDLPPQHAEDIMRFLDIERFAAYYGLSSDLYELSSGKTVQTV